MGVKSSNEAVTTTSRALYAYQWLVLLLLCPPLLVLDVVIALPVALLLWFSGAVAYGRRMVAKRDPVLAKVMANDGKGLMASLAAFGRVYTSLVAFGFHNILRIFVRIGQPKTVFVVYLSNFHLMRKFFCVGTSELIYRAGLFKGPMRPENPWVFMLGLIHVGPDVGFGVYGVLCPALSHVTQHHLEQLPATVKEEFPQARSIALAGRLPGVMTAAGVPIKAPIVDGLSGTVFAMEATVRALINNLPAERKANPTVAILGGGGYIGSRLSSVLATSPPEINARSTVSTAASKGKSLLTPQASFSLEVEPTSDSAVTPAIGMTAAVTLRDKSLEVVPVLKQIIALDTRYVGNRHSKGGVLYTAEAADLESADVVLVITRNGDDVAEYVKHAQPGQEWGDDTHPEIGREVLRALAARGVNVHKAMATRSPPTALLPPLAGWPVAGTPGCLLMALVSAATHRDWNGAGTGLVAGQDASKDTYWAFAAATKALGFHAMLTSHRRSRVEEDSTKDV